MTLPLSGQPSSSSKPLYVSGSFGHLSSLSRMPSLSLSGSGQPSSSSKPSLSSGSFGHRSSTSRMPSLSLSGSGQPSSSSKPSLSSGSSGHLSTSSGMPSPSRSNVVESRQPPPISKNELRARYSLMPPITSALGAMLVWAPAASIFFDPRPYAP